MNNIEHTLSALTRVKMCLSLIKPLKYEINRLNTFHNWNVSFIDKRTLAMLGFYSMNRSDLVKCYFCHVEIGMWEEGDDVLADHIRWSPRCDFIQRKQTNNVAIDTELLEKALQNITPPPIDKFPIKRSTTTTEGTIEDANNDEMICIICFTNKRNIVLLPCGHITTCAMCTNRIKSFKCPICRKFVTQKNKIFFS